LLREEGGGEGGAEGAGEVGATLGPVEAGAGNAPSALSQVVGVDPERTEPGLAVPCEVEVVAVEGEDLALEERVGDGDAESAGEVVVAGASACEWLEERVR
jgi:hypothetical protein